MSDIQNLLDRYFEVAFSAPEGVKRLRELILNLAMRGLLVPQDPTAQPARELLREIEAEKEQLIREENFKKSKFILPLINPNETPFNIPKTWKWCYLDHLAIIARGGSPRPIQSFLTDDLSGFNWIKIGDTDKNSLFITKTRERIIVCSIRNETV